MRIDISIHIRDDKFNTAVTRELNILTNEGDPVTHLGSAVDSLVTGAVREYVDLAQSTAPSDPVA